MTWQHLNSLGVALQLRDRHAYAVFKQDRFENGEYRWQAIGLVHGQTVLLVAHTVQDHNGIDHIRIISARQAEKKERKQYEQNRYLQNGFE